MPSRKTVCAIRFTDMLKMKCILSGMAALLICCAGCHKPSSTPPEIPLRGVLIDVRTLNERRETGYITGSVCIEHTRIHDDIKKVAPDTRTPIGVYCRSGRRSAIAAQVLKSIGYKNVTDYGGFEEAKKKINLPVVCFY